MKKAMNNYLLPIIKGFTVCAITLQIVLGIFYIGSNMMTVPAHWETTIYTEIAEQFILDEYMTYLYPMLIKVCKSLPLVNYQLPIYVLQIAVGLYCVYKIATGWTQNKKAAVMCAVWVNTLPFVAQAHVTLLPHSFVWAILAVMISFVAKATYQKTPLSLREWFHLLLGFTLICQLDKSYLIVSALLFVWAIALQIYANYKKILTMFIATIAFVGVLACNLGIYSITQIPGYYGRMQRSVEAALFQRVGITVLTEDFFYYLPEEVKACFSGKELEAFRKYPYQLQRTFGPTLEARYGKERANEIYWELGLLGFESATKDSVHALVTDTMNYVLPMGMYRTWQGDDDMGATSWNYQQFMANAPEVSAFYIHTSQVVWGIGFLAALIAGILALSTEHKNGIRVGAILVLYILIYGLFFALRGTDIYDYKLSLLPLSIACVPICHTCIRYLTEQ